MQHEEAGATMRVLMLADIHSNWPALQAIVEAESFDVCLVAGDLVDYLADPAPCIEWCRNHARSVIRGNHDHAVAQRVAARGGSGFRRLAAATRPLHWQLVSPRRLKYLGRLPVTRYERLEVGSDRQRSIFLVHGTPRDPLDEYLRANEAAWTDRLSEVDPGYVCVGHTHEPMHLQLERHEVINPGSVGQPRDGQPGAAYAVLEDGRVHLRRQPYDITATLRQMREVGVAPWAVDLTEAVLKNGGQLSKSEMDAFDPDATADAADDDDAEPNERDDIRDGGE